MIIKQCQFPGRDERGIYLHLLHPGYDNKHLVKEAQVSPPQLKKIQALMRDWPRRSGELPVLVSAMGAGEYWSSNSNGDDFPEEALIHTPSNWDNMDLATQRRIGQSWEWGYPTFYNALAYQHHVNKDPARAFGDVVYVMWDDLMKRVLLVINFSRQRAKEQGAVGVLDRVENGEFPDVSMGAKVPADFCSICSEWDRIIPLQSQPRKLLAEHKRNPIRGVSTTRADYCQHLQFELNKIYPDGRKVRMLNLHPKFFDLSVVFIGADKTSKIMAKLAGERMCPIRNNALMCKKGCYDCAIPSSHVYEVWSGSEKMAAEKPKVKLKKQAVTFPGLEMALQEEREKTADLSDLFGIDKTAELTLAKKAEIIKQIRSNFSNSLPALEEGEPKIPRDIQDRLARDMPDALASAGAMGIVLKPKEFQRMTLIMRGRPELANDLDDRGVCFRPGAAPDGGRHMIGQVVPKILSMLAPLIQGRSGLGPPVHRRIINITIVKRPETPQSGLEEDPVLKKISSAYSEYRQQLLYKSASLIRQVVHEHPWVAAEILGEVPERSFTGGLVKAGGDVIESMIGMFPIDYLNKVYLTQPVSQFVDENCSLAGLEMAGELVSSGRVA